MELGFIGPTVDVLLTTLSYLGECASPSVGQPRDMWEQGSEMVFLERETTDRACTCIRSLFMLPGSSTCLTLHKCWIHLFDLLECHSKELFCGREFHCSVELRIRI